MILRIIPTAAFILLLIVALALEERAMREPPTLTLPSYPTVRAPADRIVSYIGEDGRAVQCHYWYAAWWSNRSHERWCGPVAENFVELKPTKGE